MSNYLPHEEKSELRGEEWPREVESFLAVVVAVVLLQTVQRAHEQLVHRVAQEEALGRVGRLGGSHVRLGVWVGSVICDSYISEVRITDMKVSIGQDRSP